MEIKQIIKRYREQKGITQEQLATLINITPQAIGNYESGIRTPDWLTIKQLKRALDIPASVIVGEVQQTVVEQPDEEKKPFFLESDFLRFCAMWEWDDVAADINPNGITKKEFGMEYRVFAGTPFIFLLQHGQIIWDHPSWDVGFVEHFDQILDSLKQKRLYESRTLFSVSYEDDYTHEIITVEIEGFENDSEEDIFVMASVKALMTREITLQECSEFRVVSAK